MNPLLADNIGDIIGLIVTLAIIGFSVLSQVLGGGDKAKQQQQARRLQQQQQRARQPNKPQAKSIESEIEDFLRQARGDAPREAMPVAQPVDEESEAVRTLVKEPMEVRPIEGEPIQPGQDFTRDLASHVESHISLDSISQRDAHLGDIVEASDERIEQHLEDVFDHQVGQIAHQDHTESTSMIAEGTDAVSWEEKVEKSTLAMDIAAMMKSPDSVRKMFIVTEIFKRPEI